MQFKQCCICGLNLPINVMRPIQVKHQGKLVVIGICDRCREIKETEAKRRPNENL
jgi:hypothetical protein